MFMKNILLEDTKMIQTDLKGSYNFSKYFWENENILQPGEGTQIIFCRYVPHRFSKVGSTE